jgi:hypothetical protein
MTAGRLTRQSVPVNQGVEVPRRLDVSSVFKSGGKASLAEVKGRYGDV